MEKFVIGTEVYLRDPASEERPEHREALELMIAAAGKGPFFVVNSEPGSNGHPQDLKLGSTPQKPIRVHYEKDWPEEDLVLSGSFLTNTVW